VELKRRGIVAALHELAANTQDLFGVSCHFTAVSGIRLTDIDMASQLYRIAQEAVNNAARHGHAKSIGIRLSRRHGYIVLSIHDNGIGMHRKGSYENGMGLRIMKHRADVIGAVLQIDSARGKGTTVSCLLPLPRAGMGR